MIHPLRRLRFELGDLTQAEMAALLGRSPARLSEIENRNGEGGLAYLEALKSFLACTLDEAKALCDGTLADERFQLLVAGARSRLAAGASVGGAVDGHAEGTPAAPGPEPETDVRPDRVQPKPVVEA